MTKTAAEVMGLAGVGMIAARERGGSLYVFYNAVARRLFENCIVPAIDLFVPEIVQGRRAVFVNKRYSK